MNPFFNAMGGNRMPGPFGNMQQIMQLVQQFMQFRQNFQGDPKAEIQRLLQSGKITQDQLNQAQSMAQQIQSFLK